jgi:hypothetical protein
MEPEQKKSTPLLMASLKEKIKKRNKEISEKTLDKDLDSLSNAFNKTLKVSNKNMKEILDQSLLTEQIYFNLGMKKPNWAIPYHQGTPSGDKYFQIEHGNLCTYNCLDNMFQTPIILPMIWYKTAGGWPRFMSFFEIMTELNRYIEYIRERPHIYFVTLIVIRTLSNAGDKDFSEEGSNLSKIVKWLRENQSKVKFHGDEDGDEERKTFFEAMEYISKNKKKPIMNKGYHELIMFVDGDPFWDMNIKSPNSRRMVPIEVFQKKLHESEYEQIKALDLMNKDYHKYFSETMDQDDNTKAVEERDEIRRWYLLEIVRKQQNIIAIYGRYIIDILTNSDERSIDKNDIEKLKKEREKLIFAIYVGSGNIKVPETQGTKRARHIIKADIQDNELLDNGSVDLLNEIMELEKEFLSDHVVFQSLEYFCNLDRQERSVRVAYSMERYQKRTNMEVDVNDEKKLYNMIMVKTSSFIELVHSNMPMAHIK